MGLDCEWSECPGTKRRNAAGAAGMEGIKQHSEIGAGSAYTTSVEGKERGRLGTHGSRFVFSYLLST